MQDLGGELQRNYQVQNPSDDECLQFLYFKINDQLERIGKSNSMFNLPDSAIDWTARANAGCVLSSSTSLVMIQIQLILKL
ncbi:unnamed protein product [Ambrosiozyma monospora]|uniref:Unnamed protein product n=1 Tax=Ambrosiozyma monospora TaxID=43982 RepID=A0A9W6Z7Y6_AMBMO|nr:unnamed protein product [Ambrosiozyma monospora]